MKSKDAAAFGAEPPLPAEGIGRGRGQTASESHADAPTLRYDRTTIALHWLIGLGLLGETAFGFLLDEIAPRGTSARTGVINLHKSLGIVLGLLILLRLVWRLAHTVPPFPASMPPWKRRAALLNHRLMYACMVVQPLSGYIASNFSKYGVRFFGNIWAPWGPESATLYAFFNGLHVAVSWLFTALIAGHTAVALQHLLLERDGVFSRIWGSAGR